MELHTLEELFLEQDLPIDGVKKILEPMGGCQQFQLPYVFLLELRLGGLPQLK